MVQLGIGILQGTTCVKWRLMDFVVYLMDSVMDFTRHGKDSLVGRFQDIRWV